MKNITVALLLCLSAAACSSPYHPAPANDPPSTVVDVSPPDAAAHAIFVGEAPDSGTADAGVEAAEAGHPWSGVVNCSGTIFTNVGDHDWAYTVHAAAVHGQVDLGQNDS